MKPTHNREELDSLLGRGTIGASRRDAIFETVLSHARADAPARTRWRWPLVGFGMAAIGAVAVFLFLPRATAPSLSLFRAKGLAEKAQVVAPFAELKCLGATLDACPAGSLLVVRVAGARGYVSAWAQSSSGGDRIWYFSDTDSPSVDAVATGSATTARAVKMGSEHVTGSYVVEIRVTERPMKRGDLTGTVGTTVLARGRSFLTVIPP
jgi:hypothetical protein